MSAALAPPPPSPPIRPCHGSRVSGTPQRGALLTKAIELVQLSRESGYDRSELLEIIERLP
jgi:hypothetical protein